MELYWGNNTLKLKTLSQETDDEIKIFLKSRMTNGDFVDCYCRKCFCIWLNPNANTDTAKIVEHCSQHSEKED